MKVFLRLFRYSLRYRGRFFAGVVFSFFVAVLNGVSLTGLIPIVEALREKRESFVVQFSESERDLLRKSMERNAYFWVETLIVEKRPFIEARDKAMELVPDVPEPIGGEKARRLLTYIDHPYYINFSRSDRSRLETIVYWQLLVNAGEYHPFWVVVLVCSVMVPLYFLKLIFLLICVRLIAGTGYEAVRDIRDELYRRVQRLPLTHFYRERSGELVSRMVNDVEICAAVISSNMRDAITNVFYIITHLALLAVLNLNLLLLSLVMVPLIISPVGLVTRKIRKSVTKSQELLAGLHGHLQETVSGIRIIRSAARENHEAERFRQVNDRFSWRAFKQIFYLKLSPNMVELTGVIVSLFIIALGASYMKPGEFSDGQFIAFIATLMFIIRPIIQLSSMYAKIQAASAAGDRIFSLMDREPEVVDPPRARPLQKLQTDIVFDRVHFTYPETDKEVLHGINLTVPVGSTVALVGESGGGKSTMMDLLARFFDPTDGSIRVDGHDIREYRVADHRSRIGIVTQDIFLFYGTIFQNIAYGSPTHDRREVEKAARLAYAHDFIKDFYEGYNTLVGNRGMTLSGGQRQRIAIARALLHDPEILILDEATSALDTESERLVQQALERLFQGRTTFVIAHRLSTIEKADIIVVVSDGEIVDQGTHAELMQRGGLYARLQDISRGIEQNV